MFDLTYVVFEAKVVQFFNDDIGDINGIKSTLYEDIAEEVFEKKEGIYFCTNKDVTEDMYRSARTILSLDTHDCEWP